VIPNCAATRHIHSTLGRMRPAILEPPNLGLWRQVSGRHANARRVSLDGLTRTEIRAGNPVSACCCGKAPDRPATPLTSASVRCSMPASRCPMAWFSRPRHYYVGPVDPSYGIVGPAVHTANRMDRFTDTMLSNRLLVVGKASAALNRRSIASTVPPT